MSSWIEQLIPEGTVAEAESIAAGIRFARALGQTPDVEMDSSCVHLVSSALDLALDDSLSTEGSAYDRYPTAEAAFQLARTLSPPEDLDDALRWWVRLAALSVLGDRQVDFARLSSAEDFVSIEIGSLDWGTRVERTIWRCWLAIVRKRGWEDLDSVARAIADLRNAQGEFEGEHLDAQVGDPRAEAWHLVVLYHLARAMEILAAYTTEGLVDGKFDVQQQLEAQFDRARQACDAGGLVEDAGLVALVAASSRSLVLNSVWTATRAVGSRTTDFVKTMMSRESRMPIFELLPPQRVALRDQGLMTSAARSVVVSLPTSSGKTLIAQFRILQALGQFEREKGWVAYVAPTRALVNQITQRLRRDFAPLGINVEKFSPALEVDPFENAILGDDNADSQFRVLVATPEKLDMLLRGGWEEQLGRPLTLVVVDEAHNLADDSRGLRLELLLATINRECRDAQFLLLTPFIENAGAIADWLDPSSSGDIQLAANWTPNDRVIAISSVVRGDRRGEFGVELTPVHTTRRTLDAPARTLLPEGRTLGLSWSQVRTQSNLAAATAFALQERGSTIVLAQKPSHTWPIASRLAECAGSIDRDPESAARVEMAQAFFSQEYGADFPLSSLIGRGVGVHHTGLSDDGRSVIEWLFERGDLNHLVATTTIAQGVNFPVSSVVLASHQYPYGQDFPPEDFWNIAGRTGRVGQGDLGIVALAASSAERAPILEKFVNRQVRSLDSTLVNMVLELQGRIDSDSLVGLSYEPKWSAFLQYLAHSYRQTGNAKIFEDEIEQVLRGAYGYQELRRRNRGAAQDLLDAARMYSRRLAGKPLALVDATGFSWESVNAALGRLGGEGIGKEVWNPTTLFARPRGDLSKLMGVILQVPELRGNLDFAIGGEQVNGSKLAEITSEWVSGLSLREVAERHFRVKNDGTEVDPNVAMTTCCNVIYRKLVPTITWGLAAMQSMTMQGDEPSLSQANLPSRVLYGVNADSEIALRAVGVPRQAANGLARNTALLDGNPTAGELRDRIGKMANSDWDRALGANGKTYRRVWQIVELGV